MIGGLVWNARTTAVAALVALLVGAATGWWVNGWRLGAELERTKSDVALLESEIGTQNMMIQSWKATADMKQAAVDEARGNAAKERRRADAKAAVLYGLELPKDECDALRTLVDAARADADRLP